MVKIPESKYKSMFLKASDLTDDITAVEVQRYGLVDTPISDDPQDVIFLIGYERPLNLNKTNMASLIDILGDETDAWIGKKIRLVKSMANNPQTGSQVETIRIKAHTKQPKKDT